MLKINDLVAFAKAGYTPKQVRQIKEYMTSVEKPEDVFEFVKAGWKPEDIKELITTDATAESVEAKVEDKVDTSTDPLEALKSLLDD